MKTLRFSAVLAIVLGTTSALAAPESAPPEASTGEVKAPAVPLADALTGEAKADYEAAKLLYGDGDFAGALVKFSSAYEKASDPRLLWNMAACEKNLRHYAKVLSHVRAYLKAGDATLSAEDKAQATALLEAIEPFTAKLDLATNEPGAKVYVDGEWVGDTPLAEPVVVDIGVRKVRVTKDNFTEVTRDVPVGGSPSIHVDVKLEKIVHEGKLSVTTQPKGLIFVDGVRVGMGEWTGTLPSGGHMLRVTAPDMRAYQSEVLIRDKETRNLNITLDREPKSGGVPAWVWIGGGVLVAAGAAVGGYFLFKPEDKAAPVPVGTLEPGTVQASFPGLFQY